MGARKDRLDVSIVSVENHENCKEIVPKRNHATALSSTTTCFDLNDTTMKTTGAKSDQLADHTGGNVIIQSFHHVEWHGRF